MGKLRKPFQGVWNIIRFNWQFYVYASVVIISILIAVNYVDERLQSYFYIVGIAITLPTIVSLLVSFYIYDLSPLYKMHWLDDIRINEQGYILNIHAGFDETSILLKSKYPKAVLDVFDFYDPIKHTEVSIKRARKAYPPYPNTKAVLATEIPIANNSIDAIFVIFAAHEIRNQTERIAFLEELKRIVKPTGKIIVTEHLRDSTNFLAYTVGFLHFYSKTNWLYNFAAAKLFMVKEKKITNFISTFILDKNGITT